MNKIKIALFDSKSYDREFFERTNLKNGKFDFEIHYFTPHLNEDTALLSKGFDAVCVFVNDTISPNVASKLIENNVKLIALRSAGYNNVDLKTVYNKILVVRVPAYSPYAVAEHAVALMMALNRKTHRAYFRTRENNFSINGLLGFDMHGKTVGIIGTGKIGKALSEIMNGFGMRVIAFDVYPDLEYASKQGITYVDIDTIYRESDIISLHCPLTPENVHMINRNSISRMKNGVMIINTGRGKLINTKDLIDALKNQTVGAAGLDVYEEEGDFFFEDFSAAPISDDVLARLMTFPNVIVTSHQAFFTREALESIAYTTLENVRLFFQEGLLPNEICFKCEES
jgi:D-lactate dehydrogenase